MRKFYLGLAYASKTSIDFWLDLSIEDAIAWADSFEQLLSETKEGLTLQP
jgi:hypothetical protein